MTPASSGLWVSRGAAAPGATSAERPGSCQDQATRALPADAVPAPAAPATPITGAQRRAGLDAWLAGLARDTGILSRICRTTRRNIPLKPELPARCRRQHDRNQSGRLAPQHTTRSQGRLGRCQAPVIQTAAGFAPTLELPRVSRLMCSWLPGAGLPDSGHVRAGSGWL
jgi:hypothetical protein